MNPKTALKKFAIAAIFLVATVMIGSIPAMAANFNIRKISDNSNSYNNPQINNHGQIVWGGFNRWYGDYLPSQIYFFDGIKTTQLTNNNDKSYEYGCPKINDLGHIVWWVCNYPEIYFYDGNSIRVIASNNSTDRVYINNIDQIVWRGTDDHIYLYDKDQVKKISSGTYNNRYPQINNKGKIVWAAMNDKSQYNFDIYLWSNGVISNLSNTPNEYDCGPRINNKGDIVWNVYSDAYHAYYGLTSLGVRLLRNGQIIKVVDYGQAIDINDTGQILWSIYHDGNWSDQSWDYYLYDNGININIVSKEPIATWQNDFGDRVRWLDDFGRIVLIYIGPNDSGYDDRIYYYNIAHSLQIINDIRLWIYPPSINNIGQFVWIGINDSAGEMGVYLATPQVVDVPTPTATPPINTFPPPQNLFTDSGSFIRNKGPSFSAPTQQYLNDNLSALDKFLLNAPVNNFLLHTLSSPGWKSAFGVGEIVSGAIGSVLSLSSIQSAAAKSIPLAKLELSLWAGKTWLYQILKTDYGTRAAIDSASALASVAVTGFNPISFLLNANGIIYGDFVAWGFANLANDPPDPNFQEVYQSPVASTAPFNFPGVSTEVNKLLGLQYGSLYNTYYYMTGITTSVNRYSSALAASDAVSAGLQFEAFVKYLTLYDASAIQTADYVKQVKQALISQGLPDTSYNQQQVLDLQNQIRLNGLGSEVIDYFKSLGLTDSQISDLTLAAINYVPPGSLSGSLYANLSNGANLLRAASSAPRAPFLPAILSLLLTN